MKIHKVPNKGRNKVQKLEFTCQINFKKLVSVALPTA